MVLWWLIEISRVVHNLEQKLSTEVYIRSVNREKERIKNGIEGLKNTKRED